MGTGGTPCSVEIEIHRSVPESEHAVKYGESMLGSTGERRSMVVPPTVRVSDIAAMRSAICSDLRLVFNVISDVEEAVIAKYFNTLFSRKRYEG
jgi:tRNA threonylcarbamoyladenosine modification (KEOPS) complex  Pcc1 subunit